MPLVAISLWKTGTDGHQTQQRKGFMSGQVRKDDLLAKAVVIDGRNERYVLQPVCRRRPSVEDVKTDILGFAR